MAMHRVTNNWFFKSKLYHLPFWFMYHWMWWSIFSADSAWDVASNMLMRPYSVKFLFYFVFQAAGVYFNLYFLIPKFLERGRYVQYVLLVVLTVICAAALIVPGYYTAASLAGKSVKEMFDVDPGSYWHFFKYNTLSSSAASMTLAMSVKLAKKWMQTQQRERLLEQEKIETELKFLKSQFNPHFLFNTINSIFVLIHKDPEMASASLAKFSDLLRYQLYECNEHHIPLSQELGYLENFIELEKLRQEQYLTLNEQIEPSLAGNLSIAPFILMPFVENSFKHVSRSRQQQNFIKIHLHTKNDVLYFDIINSISVRETASSDVLHYSGIGLKNVQRRLELLYPDKHELMIDQQEDEFRVSLRLQLDEHKQREVLALPRKMSTGTSVYK
ncbi:MAG: histidine kinase [Ginsengibacter sp.]